MSVIVCSNDEIVNKILENTSRTVRVIITIREIRRHTLEKAALLGIQVRVKTDIKGKKSNNNNNTNTKIKRI